LIAHNISKHSKGRLFEGKSSCSIMSDSRVSNGVAGIAETELTVALTPGIV
jgi:hypothetical protein